METQPPLYPRTYGAKPSMWLNIFVLTVLFAAPVITEIAFYRSGNIHSRYGPARDEVARSRAPVAIAIMGTFCGFAILYLVVVAIRSRVVLTADSIAVTGALSGTRILRRSDIEGVRTAYSSKGFRMGLELVPRSDALKPVRIGTRIATDDAFRAWASGLTDLDAVDPRLSQWQ
jgi:hypothetical protein